MWHRIKRWWYRRRHKQHAIALLEKHEAAVAIEFDPALRALALSQIHDNMAKDHKWRP